MKQKRLSYLRNALMWTLLSALCGHAYAQQGAASLALTPPVPAKFGASKNFRWVEYCPDETCDVIRALTALSRDELTGAAVTYLVYFSDYSYLEDWKKRKEVQRDLANFLGSQATGACEGLQARSLAICALKNYEKRYGLEILFIRHDEGTSRSKKVNLESLEVSDPMRR